MRGIYKARERLSSKLIKYRPPDLCKTDVLPWYSLLIVSKILKSPPLDCLSIQVESAKA